VRREHLLPDQAEVLVDLAVAVVVLAVEDLLVDRAVPVVVDEPPAAGASGPRLAHGVARGGGRAPLAHRSARDVRGAELVDRAHPQSGRAHELVTAALRIFERRIERTVGERIAD